MSQPLNELPLHELILAMEEKHGVDTHMVIECFPQAGKDQEEASPDKIPTEDDVVWLIEFKDIKMMFEDFYEMRDYLINEVE